MNDFIVLVLVVHSNYNLVGISSHKYDHLDTLCLHYVSIFLFKPTCLIVQSVAQICSLSFQSGVQLVTLFNVTKLVEVVFHPIVYVYVYICVCLFVCTAH